MEKLRMGLPYGSLNDPGRGDITTEGMLKKAGFDVLGYSAGSRDFSPKIRDCNWLDLYVIRPQKAPLKLHKGELDAAIVGSDWAEEWRLADVYVNELLDLEYGNVEIAAISPRGSRVKNFGDLVEVFHSKGRQLRISTDYLNLAERYVMENPIYIEIYSQGNAVPHPVVDVSRRKYHSGENTMVAIHESYGASEADLLLDAADVIIDVVETGTTLRENDLKKIGTVMESSARLYARSDIGENSHLAERVASRMSGAVKARKFDYITFDVTLDRMDSCLRYLAEHKLFEEEPSVVKGHEYASISIAVPKACSADVEDELRNMGAQTIIALEPRHIS